MSFDFDTDQIRRFVSIARAQLLINDDQAADLIDRSIEQKTPVRQLAIDAGVLSGPQVEIVDAFLEPDDLAPGYRLLNVLGQGALGVVYRARQERLQRDVAIKAILQARLMQSNVLQRFQKEAAAIARLQHPNIVAAYDSGTHRGRVFLVMELVNGSDLRERILSGPLPLGHALAIVRQTALGLAHAQSHQIIHRDIKPANLMLTDAPTGYDLPVGVPLVKIADFGLARFNPLGDVDDDATRLTMTGAALGTPMYCAPEQLTGDPVDHRADIYGLGATLFSMLTGHAPFDSTKLHKLVAAKVTGERPRLEMLPPETPAEIISLLTDMMHHDPEDRIADYEALIERIDEQFEAIEPDGSLVSSRTNGRVARAGGTKRAERRRSKLPWIIAATSVPVLAIIAMSAVFWSNRMPDTPPEMVETVWSQPLFNGQGLGGWTNHASSWSVIDDDEGSRVLAGNGYLSRPIPDLPAEVAQSSVAIGVRIRVDLNNADAAEVQFGFDDNDLETAARWAVRFTGRRAELGYRTSKDAEFRISESVDLDGFEGAADEPMWHEFQLQRHSDRWYASFDDMPLGSVSLGKEVPESPIQLIAVGGQAYFGDISVFGLQPASP